MPSAIEIPPATRATVAAKPLSGWRKRFLTACENRVRQRRAGRAATALTQARALTSRALAPRVSTLDLGEALAISARCPSAPSFDLGRRPTFRDAGWNVRTFGRPRQPHGPARYGAIARVSGANSSSGATFRSERPCSYE